MSALSLTPSVARGFGLLPSSAAPRTQRASGAGGVQAGRLATADVRGAEAPRDAIAFSAEALEAADRLEADANRPAESEEDLASVGPISEEVSADAERDAPGEASSAVEEESVAAPRGTDGEPLTDAEVEQVQELRARDLEVRQHEQAHAAVGGPYVTSGPQYDFQQGPDGRRYAVGGNVGIDASPEATPEETIVKARVVRRAALAPAEPSAQDYRVAAQATRLEQEARTELREQQQEVTRAGGEPDEAESDVASIDFFA